MVCDDAGGWPSMAGDQLGSALWAKAANLNFMCHSALYRKAMEWLIRRNVVELQL